MNGTPHKLRNECCGGFEGIIRPVGQQDVVRCATCNKWDHNAPRVQTGRAPRTVASVHGGITAGKRKRIHERDGFRCVLCGSDVIPHIGHWISVEAGLKEGMTEVDLNDDENLATLCEACNLGYGKEPVPLRFVLKAYWVRRKWRQSNGSQT